MRLNLTKLALLCGILVSGTLTTPTGAEQLITLPIAAQIRKVGITKFVDVDQARAINISESALSKSLAIQDSAVISINITDALVIYTTVVGFGSPVVDYTCNIDLGTPTTSYGSGTSNKVTTVTLGPGLVVTKQTVGTGTGTACTLGLGPSLGTPTVVDNLYSQGTISSDSLSVLFAPSTNESSINGELTFGGIDSSKLTSSIAYVPVTSTSPSSTYWGFSQSVTFGTTSILSQTVGIADSGTTLIYLATGAFSAYQTATKAKLDSTTGLLKITAAQYSALSNLNFVIGGTTYALIPNGQIWPRSLNSDIGGTSSGIYLIVADLGTPVGQGLDFINGFTFLQRFYSYYDTANDRIGFAKTAFTSATSN